MISLTPDIPAGSNSTSAAENQGPKDMSAYAAPSLFQPHRVRQAIRDAHNGRIPPMLGLYFGLSCVQTARYMAPLGFDWCWIDWEHSSCNVETMTTMVHEIMFMSGGKTIPFVRVPGHDHAAVGFALDCGASIVVPQVETVEQAQHVVSAAKFGTKSRGTRSAPPFRWIQGVTDHSINLTKTFHQNLNEQAAVMIQIETLQGIANLDSILTQVPDIDIVWLGSLDCRVSMDLEARGEGKEPEWVEAVAQFEKILRKHDKPYAGFAFGTASAEQGKGKCMIITAADVVALGQLGAELSETRKIYPNLKHDSVNGEKN